MEPESSLTYSQAPATYPYRTAHTIEFKLHTKLIKLLLSEYCNKVLFWQHLVSTDKQ